MRDARSSITRLVGPVVGESSILRTEPWGYVSSNYYLNEVLVVECGACDPLSLLDTLLSIELSLGRKRDQLTGPRYADRTIDIDILYIDKCVISHPRLTVPHPRIEEREFVGKLLAEISDL